MYEGQTHDRETFLRKSMTQGSSFEQNFIECGITILRTGTKSLPGMVPMISRGMHFFSLPSFWNEGDLFSKKMMLDRYVNRFGYERRRQFSDEPRF